MRVRREKTCLARAFVLLVVLLAAQISVAEDERIVRLQSARLDPQAPVSRIAFGSCFKDSRAGHDIWSAIAASGPGLFIFAGDTLYPRDETEDPALPALRAAYDELAANSSFTALREQVPVLPVWDDHDYGMNDGGADFSARKESQALFVDRWALPKKDPRRVRDGVYHSVTVGAPGRQVQVILLDTRFFRSPLMPTDMRGALGRERYIPDSDPGKTVLGDIQWRWLQEQLREPADLRLLVSSIQVLADGHGWEGWRTLPLEQARLFDLLAQHSDVPTLLLSGDRHVAGVYRRAVAADVNLVEFTSSALNNTIPPPYRTNTLAEAGPYRVGGLYGEANFGLLDIDWAGQSVLLSLRDAGGDSVRQLRWTFAGELIADSAP